MGNEIEFKTDVPMRIFRSINIRCICK